MIEWKERAYGSGAGSASGEFWKATVYPLEVNWLGKIHINIDDTHCDTHYFERPTAESAKLAVETFLHERKRYADLKELYAARIELQKISSAHAENIDRMNSSWADAVTLKTQESEEKNDMAFDQMKSTRLSYESAVKRYESALEALEVLVDKSVTGLE